MASGALAISSGWAVKVAANAQGFNCHKLWQWFSTFPGLRTPFYN